jgi:tetratricopeptide (TPR) repeat protein
LAAALVAMLGLIAGVLRSPPDNRSPAGYRGASPRYQASPFDPQSLGLPRLSDLEKEPLPDDFSALFRGLVQARERQELRRIFETPAGDESGLPRPDTGPQDPVQELEQALDHTEAAARHLEAQRYPEARAELDLALPLWRRFVEQRPQEPLLRRKLAQAQHALGTVTLRQRQWEESRRAFEEAAGNFRQLVDTPPLLVAIDQGGVLAAGRPPQDVDRTNLSSSLANLGLCLQRLGRSGEAASSFDESISVLEPCRKNPSASVAEREMLGSVFHARGHYRLDQGLLGGAADDFAQAITLRPKETAYYRDCGDVSARLARWADAARNFQELTIREPETVRLWYCRGLTELLAQRPEDYRATCRLVIERFAASGDAGTANLAAWICVLASDAVADWQPCVELARRAVSVKPSNADYLNTLGAVLYRAGQWEEAAAELDKAMRLRGTWDQPQDRLFLGLAYFRLWRGEEAQYWLSDLGSPTSAPDDSPDPARPWNVEAEIRLLRQEAAAVMPEL